MKRIFLLDVLTPVLMAVGLAVAAPERMAVPNPERTFATVDMPSAPSREYLLAENFDSGFLPAGWTSMSTGNASTWEQTTRTANSGQHSAAIFWGTAWQDEWLVSPSLDTQGLSSLYLAWAETAEEVVYFREHNIMVSTTVPDDPAAFTSVLEMKPASHSFGSDWQAVTVDLSAYVGLETVYIAFRYEGAYADSWFIDDVLVYQPFDHEVGAVQVTPIGATVFPDVELSPQFRVKNFGGNIETFEVNMVVTFEGTTIMDETMTVTELPPGEQTTVAFSSLTTEPGFYVLTGTVLLAGDEYQANDVAVGGLQCADSQRTPFGLLFTNWGCHPCVDANAALDSWYSLQGDQASLIRVHVFWPYSNDPMYLANPDQCQWFLDMCPAMVTAAPTLYMDNTWDMWDYFPGTWPQTVLDGYLMSAGTPSAIAITDLAYIPGTGQVQLSVDVLQALDPQGDYRLFVAISEDGVEAAGPNGETVHNQAFRWLFPGVEGLPVQPEAGLQPFAVPVTLDPGWVQENLRATAWVMEHPNGAVLNSATVFLAENVSAVETENPAEIQAQPRLEGAFPNPFNPRTTIRFSLEREQAVKLAVYDLAGRRIMNLVDDVLPAGDHPVVWDGRDVSGREVPSGVYFAHMVGADGIQVAKLMLVR